MKDTRILAWVFLFVGLVSALAVVIAALISRNQQLPAALPLTPTQPATQASSLLLPTPQGTLVFDENFDDGFARGITVDTDKWEVIDDNSGRKLFQMNNMSGTDWIHFYLGTTTITNGTIEYKVKLVDYDPSLGNGGGAEACHFRSNSNRYVFALQGDINDVSINYQGIDNNEGWSLLDNAVAPYIFNKNTWYEVQIDAIGNEITGYLDGKKILTAKDNRLKTGEIFCGIAPNTIAQFDDIRVWSQP